MGAGDPRVIGYVWTKQEFQLIINNDYGWQGAGVTKHSCHGLGKLAVTVKTTGTEDGCPLVGRSKLPLRLLFMP